MMMLWCFERRFFAFFFDEFCQTFYNNKVSRFHFYTFSSFSHYIFLFLFHSIISFDRSIFVFNKHSNCHVVNVANHVRQQQFAMWMNFYEIIILLFHFANSTKSTSKQFFNDVINIVNNNVTSKKRRKRFLKSKNDQRVFFVNVFAFYQSIFFEFVVVR